MVGAELVDGILSAPQVRESELRAQRERVAALERRLDELDGPAVDDLRSVLDHLIRRSVWIVGGDGWAYDIGAGGLDHVLASGKNVNVLVMDTEVYSNTGGQMSKATPLGAVAKFAAAGKTVPTKDLALQAIAYADVYVARVAFGADPQQTLRAFREAEAYDGPSLLIAYSHCVAHGYDMRDGLNQQYGAVASGHWPLIRYDPVVRADGGNPFLLDSPRPRMSLADYRKGELRFRALAASRPAEAERLLGLAQQVVDQRWRLYEEMATRSASEFPSSTRGRELMDLSTSYMGLPLRNPLVASPSPLSYTLDGIRRLAKAASARSSCSRCSRSSCVSRRHGPSGWSRRRPRASPRRSATSRRWSKRTAVPGLSVPARARRLGGRHPCDRAASTASPRRAGPIMPGRCRMPAPPRSS